MVKNTKGVTCITKYNFLNRDILIFSEIHTSSASRDLISDNENFPNTLVNILTKYPNSVFLIELNPLLLNIDNVPLTGSWNMDKSIELLSANQQKQKIIGYDERLSIFSRINISELNSLDPMRAGQDPLQLWQKINRILYHGNQLKLEF